MKKTAALCVLSALLISTSAMAVTSADGDVFARSTARTYLSDPLPKATLDTLTAAAFSAPTAVNQRSLEYIWVTDKTVMKNLKAASPFSTALATAPAVLVICANLKDTRIEDLVQFDAGAAAEAVLAEAGHLGPHSVPMSLAPVKSRVTASQKALGLPSNVIPEIMVAVGKVPADAVSGASAFRHNPARIHWNTWKGKEPK
ncbi:MAG: nitroreductase family protein [Sutterella sp.]|uniref:nitroreductase family protein n=1 Tax=Dakarella massiliensis TaxID=1506471 RepID=UPI000337E42E|nr:nitroreductase family protein [Dakarella massiliensis]MBS6156661.1 nitroreductase family protein [Sutterella sp.]CDE48423.1 nADPH nitroreductase [Sutterella sp. CAG:351]